MALIFASPVTSNLKEPHRHPPESVIVASPIKHPTDWVQGFTSRRENACLLPLMSPLKPVVGVEGKLATTMRQCCHLAGQR